MEGTGVLFRMQTRQAEQLLPRQGRGICWDTHIGATIGQSRHDASRRKRVPTESLVEPEDGKLVQQVRGHRKVYHTISVEWACDPRRVQVAGPCEFKVRWGRLQSLVLLHQVPLLQVCPLLN